jgi:hypothetical protein
MAEPDYMHRVFRAHASDRECAERDADPVNTAATKPRASEMQGVAQTSPAAGVRKTPRFRLGFFHDTLQHRNEIAVCMFRQI